MKSRVRDVHDGLSPEYHFDYSEAIRGKYSKRLATEGSNVVVLDPDVAKAFRDSNAVNDALRALLELTDATRRLTARSRGRPASGNAARRLT